MKILKKYNQYIKGNLSDSEMEDFTKEIVNEHFEKEKLQNKWSRLLEEKQKKETTKKGLRPVRSKRIIRIVLTAAASVLLLLLSWLAYPFLSTSPTEKLLSQELNNPYVETLSRKGSMEDLQLQATEAYNDGEYAAAQQYFEQIKAMDVAVDWDFYIGLCQLYQKNTAQAVQSFIQILEQPNKKYEVETNWYLGIAYLLDKDFASAKKHLQFVADQAKNGSFWKVKEANAFLNAFAEKE